jgi:hypothetical protein
MRILVIGKIGDAHSWAHTKHSSLFESADSPVLKDDNGKTISPRPDLSTNAYTEILQQFSGIGDWVLFPRFLSGMFDNNYRGAANMPASAQHQSSAPPPPKLYAIPSTEVFTHKMFMYIII